MYGSSLYLNQVDGVFSLPYINAYFSVQFTIITFDMIDHVVRRLANNATFEYNGCDLKVCTHHTK